MHKRLRLPEPPVDVANARVISAAQWSANEPAEISLALGGPDPLRLEVEMHGADPLEFTTSGDGILHRYRLLAGGTSASETPLAVRVVRAESSATGPLLEIEMDVVQAQVRLDALDARIQELLSAEVIHPLFAHHLRSIRALAHSEWGRLLIYRQTDPQLASLTLERLAKYTEALHGEVGEWAAYLDGRRSLLMAYISNHDGTLQFYQLGLPRDWDPEQSYPLFFELHGAGDENPFAFPSRRLFLTEAPPDLYGYTAPKTYAEIQRNGYWVHPFGRGNLGYRGIAEIDIFEAYDDVHARFHIDPDRRYLYGFSMGGGGTWANALRTPDRWAAVAILAGAPRGNLGKELIPNIRHMPVWIWCGEEDRLFPRTLAMVEALRENGIEPVFSSTPGIGHNYMMEKQRECLDWLQQHVRQRPDAFTFRTDSDRLLTAWGVSVARDPTMSCLPGFTARLEGNVVHIDSEGTPEITVNAGDGGLGLEGEFTFILNGIEVYNGPVCELRLSTRD